MLSGKLEKMKMDQMTTKTLWTSTTIKQIMILVNRLTRGKVTPRSTTLK